MLVFWMWHLFLSSETNVLILTNRSTCSEYVGKLGLESFLQLCFGFRLLARLCCDNCDCRSLPQSPLGRGCVWVPCFLGYIPISGGIVRFSPFCHCWMCSRSDVAVTRVAIHPVTVWASADQVYSSRTGNSGHLGRSWAAVCSQGDKHRKFSTSWCLRTLSMSWSAVWRMCKELWCFPDTASVCRSWTLFLSGNPDDIIKTLLTTVGNGKRHGILGNQAEYLPEDSRGTFLQTRLENLGITYYCVSHVSSTATASAAT